MKFVTGAPGQEQGNYSNCRHEREKVCILVRNAVTLLHKTCSMLHGQGFVGYKWSIYIRLRYRCTSIWAHHLFLVLRQGLWSNSGPHGFLHIVNALKPEISGTVVCFGINSENSDLDAIFEVAKLVERVMFYRNANALSKAVPMAPKMMWDSTGPIESSEVVLRLSTLFSSQKYLTYDNVLISRVVNSPKQ